MGGFVWINNELLDIVYTSVATPHGSIKAIDIDQATRMFDIDCFDTAGLQATEL